MSDNNAIQKNIRVVTDSTAEEWNACAPHPLQTYEWGEARKKHGLVVVRFGVYEEEILTSVFQMTIHKLGAGFSLGYVAQSTIPTSAMINFVKEYAQAHKIIFVKWEPCIQEGIMPSGLTQSNHSNFYEYTRRVTLTGKTSTELRAELEKKTRYNIGLAERSGVSISEHTDERGFELFADLFFKTAERKKYGGHSRIYHEIIWNTFRAAGISRIFTAHYNGVTLAAYEVFIWKGVWYTPYSGTSSEYREVKAKNYLLWKIIERAQEEGAQLVDLWGTLPDTNTGEKAWAGFSSFKKGYGGEIVQLPGSYDLVVFSGMYFLYGIAFRLRKWWRK